MISSVCSLADYDPPHGLQRQWQLQCRTQNKMKYLNYQQSPQQDRFHSDENSNHCRRAGYFLPRGQVTGVRSDQTHHLLQEKMVERLRAATLVQVVLGLLNSGAGGRVFLGLSEGGLVEGVRMTLHQRDTCMLGVSRCLRQDLLPPLLPCDHLVEFVPVQEPGRAGPAGYLDGLGYYVVIITVRPSPGRLYRSPVAGPLLLRHGCSNLPLQGPHLQARLKEEQRALATTRHAVAEEKRNLCLHT